MTKNPYELDWSKLAFGNKKSVNELRATFIAAPREISSKRFIQLVKEHLPKGNIIVGIAKEEYIDGFDDQPQFRTLQKKTIINTISKVNSSTSQNKIYTLTYHQREIKYILRELKFAQVLFINGSWLYAFHTRSEFYELTRKSTPFKLISPFADEKEAKLYEATTQISMQKPENRIYSQEEIFSLVDKAAKQSYDYMFQAGAAIAEKVKDGYKPLLTSYNKVVPFQTYALHNGASRETNYSPPNDLNHYDTVHAEVDLITQAQQQKVSLKDTTLFINLMPCPTCSRMLANSDISHIMYQQDHSDGYAIKMLEASGKTITRVVI